MRWLVNFVLLWLGLWIIIGVLHLFGISGTCSTGWVIGTSMWFAFVALFWPIEDWDF